MPCTSVSVKQLRAGRSGGVEMCLHAILDEQVAGGRFEDADADSCGTRRPGQRRSISAAESGSTGRLMLGRGTQHAGHDDAVRRARLRQADLVEQLSARLLLQLVPQPVAFEQQRHVIRVLEIGLADDARVAVRAAAIVRRMEAVDAEHAHAAARQMIQRGTAHAAGAEHDRVVAFMTSVARRKVREPRCATRLAEFARRHCHRGYAFAVSCMSICLGFRTRRLRGRSCRFGGPSRRAAADIGRA